MVHWAALQIKQMNPKIIKISFIFFETLRRLELTVRQLGYNWIFKRTTLACSDRVFGVHPEVILTSFPELRNPETRFVYKNIASKVH